MSALLGTNGSVATRPSDPGELTRDLYERYGQRVFTFCYSRLRNREAAQDAAQTTFIYVLRALQRGVEPEFELAWLLKIAFNVCRGARRSAGRETAVRQDVDDMDGLAAPAAGPERTERLAALRAGLATLPDNQRRGILLREWQGLSYAEIADELGVTVGAVETLLFRARRNLAARLQDVRSSVVALNGASFAGIFRSAFRGGLLKLGLVGASASIALVPVVASKVSPALANRAELTRPSLHEPRTPSAATGSVGRAPSAVQAPARPVRVPSAAPPARHARRVRRPISEKPSPSAPASGSSAAASDPVSVPPIATPPASGPPAAPPPAEVAPPPPPHVQDAVKPPVELAPVDQLAETVDGVVAALP